MMNIQDVKSISIKDYLQSQGISPSKEYSGYGMYRSPLRDERTPSFKVDYNRNLWHDFGSGEGGSIIDLVMKMLNYSSSQAMQYLSSSLSIHSRGGDHPFSFHRDSVSNKEKSNRIILTTIKSIEHSKLLEYLRSRKIDLEIAREHCREVHYQTGGRNYFAIGFANDAGGYEIRNPAFKGCIAPKDITCISQDYRKETCYLFEGFLDYLSLLTIQYKNNPEFPGSDWQDYIILNSATNLPKALYPLTDYERIHCFLDNDMAGRTVYRELEKEFGFRVRDASRHYGGDKDLNDYFCGKKQLKAQPVIPKSRGMKL